jgi:hypothetical protein
MNENKIKELEKKAEFLEKLRLEKYNEFKEVENELLKVAEKLNELDSLYLVVDVEEIQE